MHYVQKYPIVRVKIGGCMERGKWHCGHNPVFIKIGMVDENNNYRNQIVYLLQKNSDYVAECPVDLNRW